MISGNKIRRHWIIYCAASCAASLFALIVFLQTAQATEERTLEYSWLTADRVSGMQTASYAVDGTIDVRFAYSGRGRGPEFESQLRLNEQGLPDYFQASGKNNARADIDERFIVENGEASWRSAVERSVVATAGDTFYLPHNSSPEVLAILARALLDDRDGRLGLLPDGEATIKHVSSTEVESDRGSRKVSLYSISGIDAQPRLLWLDENRDLFSFTDRHFGIVRKGWESVYPALKAIATEAGDRFLQSISDELTQPLEGLTIVTGARIFDSLAGKLTEPATVFVWDGRISAIEFGDVDLPDDARVIDAHGKTLMPSLWDMHNHVNSGHLVNYVASGVLNVRDMGNNHRDLQPLIDKVRAGVAIGPDVFPMGFIDKRNEFAAPVGRLAGSIGEALDHVNFYARRGYYGVKLYSAVEPEWVAQIASAAKARGLGVAGHIPAFMSARQAIDAGFTEITHANMMLLNFLDGETHDTRGPARFVVPGIEASGIDVDSREVLEFLGLMREKSIAHDPTLAVIVELFTTEPGELSPIFSEVADHLPVFERRKVTMSAGYNQGHEEEFARSVDTVFALIARMHREGIRMYPGSDNFLPGFTIIRDLRYFAETGIPTNEVLQLGTIEAARQMGLEHRLGSISVGKDAHMYLVDGNPVEDLTELYRVEHVIKGRQLFYAPDLLRSQGVTPFTD